MGSNPTLTAKIMSEPDKKIPGPKTSLRFGMPGHESEYVLTFHKDPHSEAEEIPEDWQEKLREKLGPNWSVLNRGFRIEIVPPSSNKNEEEGTMLRSAIDNLGQETK